MSNSKRISSLTLALGLALGTNVASAGLLGNLTQALTAPTKSSTSTSTSQNTQAAQAAAVLTQAVALADTINTLFPNMAQQAQTDPTAIYQMYAASLINPMSYLPLLAGLGGGSGNQQAFLAAFPSAESFAGWLALLQTDPNAAASQYTGSATTLGNMNVVTQMLGDRLPANLASNLPMVGVMLAQLTGTGSTASGAAVPGCGDGGILGAILNLRLGGTPLPSPQGKGYGPSLLPYQCIGASPTGAGFAQSLEYTPLLNSNAITQPLRDVITRSLPLMTPILPHSILGIVTFRTYHTTDRTGAGTDQYDVMPNDPRWTAGAIDIGLPGTRLFTVEMVCPGLSRHSVAATSPTASNPGFDPSAESNYTGYTNLDLTNKKMTFSWGFGDGLVDDVWVYGHYLLWTAFGQGDPGPGMMTPAEHAGMSDDMNM